MHSTKLLFDNVSFYMFSNVIKALIGFILVPIYTYYLTLNDFGIISVVTSITAFLSIFYTLSLSSSVIRFYSKYSIVKENLIRFISSIITFLLLSNFLLTFLLITFKDYIFTPFVDGINFYPYIFIGLLSATLTPLFLVTQTINQAVHNAKKYAIISLSQYLLNISLVVFTVIYLRQGAFGVLISQLISISIFFLFSVFKLFKEYKFHISKKYLKETLNYSLPLIPHSLSAYIIDLFDRILLNNLKSTADVGIYNVGYKFGSLLDFVVSSVHLSFSPWFMENVAIEREQKKIVRFTEFIISFYCLIALFISLFGKEIFRFLLSEEFEKAYVVLPFISFSYVIIGTYYFFGYSLFYMKGKTKLINISTFIAAGLNVFLNFLLIPNYGTIGAGLATLCSFLVSSIITLILSNNIDLIRYNYVKIYSFIFSFFILSLVFNDFTYLEATESFLIKVLVFLLVLLFLSYYYVKELRLVYILFKGRLTKN